MKTKSRKKGTVLMFIGLLLLAAALSLTVYNIYDAKRAEEAAAAVVPNLKEKIEEAGAAMEQPDNPVLVNPDREMPSVEIDGERYIGVLEIPDIQLTLPIMSGWNYSRLKIAPCLYQGSVYQDNMVIAGHNYARHFSPIKNLPVGTTVRFTDGENRTFEYEIGWVEVLNGEQVEEMVTGEWDMTMFTCTYGGEARYAVRCFRK